MCRELYNTLEWRPDSLESQAFIQSTEKEADQIRNKLWDIFRDLNGEGVMPYKMEVRVAA